MKYLSTLAVCFFALLGNAQSSIENFRQSVIHDMARLDSLERLLPAMPEDTAKVNQLSHLAFLFAFNQAEKSVRLGQEGVLLSSKLGYKNGLAHCNQTLGWGLWGVGDYSKALQTAFISIRLFEELNDRQGIMTSYYLMANIYRDFGDYPKALENAKIGFRMSEPISINELIGSAIIASIFDYENQLDSANFYLLKAFEINKKVNLDQWGWPYFVKGNVHRKLKQYDLAMYYYRLSLPLVQYKDIVETYNGMAILYQETGKIDSSIFYAREVLEKWSFVSYKKGILQATNILAGLYKIKNQRDSVIKYLELSNELKNSMYSQQNERNIQNMAFDEQARQEEAIRERKRLVNQLILYAVLFIGVLFIAIAILQWRNIRHKQKAYVILQKQKQETDLQRTKAERTLVELKNTQTQLIQKEKLASLGELTAGIAHEIQNPLNFVNNFSELSVDLVKDLKEEIEKTTQDKAYIGELFDDLSQNQEKINHHGKRASSIVKGMLEHSRASTGVKELTDINKLADEYLRLSYHGLRAKDKDFNADYTTEFDENLPKIEVIPQDMGRVLLNLINNAFYAVNQRKQQLCEGSKPSQSLSAYTPSVFITTQQLDNQIIIKVKDNGMGMSEVTKAKVFQPFFTTKPTGQGTGLGLSLAYDIVTKGHGGALEVNSTEGVGSEFIITIPSEMQL